MSRAPFLRSLISAALALTTSALLAVACGGSTNKGGSTGKVEPGGVCASESEETLDDCNTCRCVDNQWSCTERACPRGDSGTNGCTPGDRSEAADGCNTCTCTESGDWECTAMGCGGAGPGSGCTPGDSHPAANGCDMCGCTQGGTWECSHDGCGSGGAPPLGCVPGETERPPPDSPDWCNTCTCTDTGAWACTREECPEPPAPQCKEGDALPSPDGCNSCSCVNGQILCTLMLCPVCEPGETSGACGECSCVGGQWACTNRYCPPPDGGAEKGCGGWLGDTCGADEYCAYVEGQLCGAADASSACKPRPQGCDDVYDPVCGCDGKTHGNACEAAVAGTGVRSKGTCISL